MAVHRGEFVIFQLEHETGVEECAVACDALRDLGRAHRADTSSDDLLNIFETHREKIEAAALAKLRSGNYSSIVVTSPDLGAA